MPKTLDEAAQIVFCMTEIQNRTMAQVFEDGRPQMQVEAERWHEITVEIMESEVIQTAARGILASGLDPYSIVMSAIINGVKLGIEMEKP